MGNSVSDNFRTKFKEAQLKSGIKNHFDRSDTIFQKKKNGVIHKKIKQFD